MAYNKLFSPIIINGVTIKNRGVMTAMMAGFLDTSNGDVDERLITYYEERARGGVGLIITEGGVVDEKYGIVRYAQMHYTRTHITGLAKLNEKLHSYGTKTIAQLWHGGGVCSSKVTGRQVVSASDVESIPGEKPRPLTIDEIRYITRCFADAAVVCQQAGYDGVEIHLAHGYLLSQFMSPYFNKRTDEYGGSWENRIRFADEVVRAVREAVGKRMIIGIRISGDEMASNLSPLHLTAEDGIRIARHFDESGLIDYINVSNGNKYTPNSNCDPFFYECGWKEHIAKAIKEAVHIPIIATNTIKTPEMAEGTLERGVCDLVGLGRAHLADPQFMNKALLGRENEIKCCIGCLFCREPRGGGQMAARCAVNPRAGIEVLYPRLPKDGEGRPVAVVGAGPAGMEAALVLADRGFSVTLYDENDSVGGSMNLADKPDHKWNITRLIMHYHALLKRAGVRIITGVKATPDIVAELDPVGVFLACGANPIVPKLPGVDLPNVYTAQQVVREKITFPNRDVVIIGTGMTGLETAEIISKDSRSVNMIEMQSEIGPGLIHEIVGEMKKILVPRGVKFYTSHKLTGIAADGVEAINLKNGEAVFVPGDVIILSLGVSPDRAFIESFQDRFDSVYPIGDAVQSGRIGNATQSAFSKAYAFRPVEDLLK